MTQPACHRRAAALVALVALTVLAAACGSASRAPARAPTPAAPVPSAEPPVSPPGTPGPAPSPAASPPGTAPESPTPPGSFTGTVVHAPGARVRYGPGMDMPVMDIDPVGRVEAFDGWFRRLDDAPQIDEITGRLEWWSRDWLHLADGRGWVHSAAVSGTQPAGMAETAWTRPAVLPGPTAGLMDIAIDLQDRPVTCEVASLKMALGWRGSAIDEGRLLELTGVDARPPEEDRRGDILRWGNPNQVFVGDPDGHVFDHTGYGVYAGPIARAAAGAGAGVVSSGPGIGPADVYAAVLAGHPVVAWVTSDFRPGVLRSWQAWDGSSVRYALTEHAVLVIGVTPTSVLVDDPTHGRNWHTRSEFQAAYGTFANMAVVIR